MADMRTRVRRAAVATAGATILALSALTAPAQADVIRPCGGVDEPPCFPDPLTRCLGSLDRAASINATLQEQLAERDKSLTAARTTIVDQRARLLRKTHRIHHQRHMIRHQRKVIRHLRAELAEQG